MAEASRQPRFCYDCGPMVPGSLCLPPRERLRSLFDTSRKATAFDMSMLPSTSSLSNLQAH
eukprot:16232348-Heterocapsa_arctica.AAC.1